MVDQSAGDETEHLIGSARHGVVPVRYVRQSRRGLSASRNQGLSVASCPVVAMTDDDCVPDQGWVAALADSFGADGVAAVSGRVMPYGPDVRGMYAVSSRLSTARATFERKGPPWMAGSGGNFAVRREVWSRLGGFDERLGAGSAGLAAEDMDFIYRMLCAGEKILYDPSAIVYHERQDLRRRTATRWSYGYGIGAACGKWLRLSDPYAARVLAGWMVWRTRGLLTAVRRREAQAINEHGLMLRGTLAGLAYGLRLRGVR